MYIELRNLYEFRCVNEMPDAQGAERLSGGVWEEGGHVHRDGVAGIPRNERAHLMYYLHCVCSLLELDHDDKINR